MEKIQNISRAEATKRWLSGELVVIAEVRSFICEDREWRDKKTGRMEKGTFLTHNLEIGPMAAPLSERLPEGVTKAGYVWPFKKGDSVLVKVDSVFAEKGVTQFRGAPVAILKD